MLITEPCRLWLDQFAKVDRSDAEQLLKGFHYVDADTFRLNLTELITSKLPAKEPVAFYVERKELPATKTMYTQYRKSRGKGKKPTLRAEGSARVIIRPEKYVNQVVGSEGVLANLASQWQRANPAHRWVAPSTRILRTEQVRHLVVITDVIGSGLRVNGFLSLLWDTRSIKSWCSYHKTRIWVFAYCATEKGSKMVVAHPSKPTVEVVSACPTVWDQGPRTSRAELRLLCRQYSPVAKDSLGYKDVGALVAFAHGCPNDAPAIFHKSSKSVARPWKALFPGRVTLAAAPKEVPDSLTLALDTLGFGLIQHTSAYPLCQCDLRHLEHSI